MAVLQFSVFERAFCGQAPVNSVEFWDAMQLAIAGFVTSYPMNWWLIRVGLKERMYREAHASMALKGHADTVPQFYKLIKKIERGTWLYVFRELR